MASGSEPFSFRRINPDDPAAGDRALSLLLTGTANPLDAAVVHFKQFLEQQEMTLDNCWVVLTDDVEVACCLVVRCKGLTGMIFQTPIVSGQLAGGRRSTAGASERLTQDPRSALVAHVCAQEHPDAKGELGKADSKPLSLIQAMLDPGQALEEQTLKTAGFTFLADLSYMACRIERNNQHAPEPDLATWFESLIPEPPPVASEPAAPPNREFAVLTYDDSHRGTFARCILASYEQTNDCPALVGLRAIDDIIDGHMAAGRFVPQLWTAVTYRDEPVAVLLLNMSSHVGATELIYLGVSPAWRGKGIARRMMEHAMHQAAHQQAKAMILAVDECNTPAVKLYRSLRFSTTMRKRALIYALQSRKTRKTLGI